jgi:hypothetical protein
MEEQSVRRAGDRPLRQTTYLDHAQRRVTSRCRLEPVPEGTKLYAEFEPRPHGWFRLIFPIFLHTIRREEKANMGYLREAVERHVQSAEQRHDHQR